MGFFVGAEVTGFFEGGLVAPDLDGAEVTGLAVGGLVELLLVGTGVDALIGAEVIGFALFLHS